MIVKHTWILYMYTDNMYIEQIDIVYDSNAYMNIVYVYR